MPSFNHREVARMVAADLLDIEAVFLRPDEPFTWASGIRSPIYCDNRLILSHPQVRTRVERGLADLVEAAYPETEMLMGTATAGIAHAALAADLLELPMGYVRGGSKGHGRGNQIEGGFTPGQHVVVIEDLISTGGSSLDVVTTLREAGCEVIGLIAIFTYGMARSIERFKEAAVSVVTLTNYDELLKVAVDTNYIDASAVTKLKQFMADPQSSDWMNA